MSRSERGLGRALGALALLSGVLLLGIVAHLLMQAWPVLAGPRAPGLGGLLGLDGGPGGWHPLEGRFDLSPMIAASAAAAGGALLLAAPFGLACAIHEHFLAGPRTARLQRLGIGLLAGIPSVVFGLWGLTVLVPLIGRWQPPGASLLAAMLVLALMIVPTVALLASAALAQVPRSVLQGAAALGLSRRAIVLGVALPAARSGLWAALLLALARALGETLAVLMVAGNVVAWPAGLFEPLRVLTANIALEMAYAEGLHRASLYAAGLLLTALVLLLAGLGLLAGRGLRAGRAQTLPGADTPAAPAALRPLP